MVIYIIPLEDIEHAKKEEDDGRSIILLMVHGEAAAAPRGDGNSEINPMLQLLSRDISRL